MVGLAYLFCETAIQSLSEDVVQTVEHSVSSHRKGGSLNARPCFQTVWKRYHKRSRRETEDQIQGGDVKDGQVVSSNDLAPQSYGRNSYIDFGLLHLAISPIQS